MESALNVLVALGPFGEMLVYAAVELTQESAQSKSFKSTKNCFERRTKMAIVAKVKAVVERRSANDPYGQIEEYEVEFEKIGEIEHFLAYNRAYIRAIEFVGKIEDKEEE